MAFRNVDVSPDDPVVEWPLEAIQAALERGGLSQWRRLTSAIRAQPWAEFASRIGTSASRLSTYATGRVTPSAALMLRMRHLESA